MYLPFNLLTITAISIAFTFFCFAADNVFKRSANYHWSFLIACGIAQIIFGILPSDVFPNIAFFLLTMLISISILLLMYQSVPFSEILTLILLQTLTIFLIEFWLYLLPQGSTTLSITAPARNAYARTLYIFINYILAFLMLHYMQRHNKTASSIGGKGFSLCLLFFLCDLIVVLLLLILLAYYAPIHKSINLICLLIACCLVPITTVCLHLLYAQSKEQAQTLENTLLKMQITEQEKQLKAMEDKNIQLRVAKHDMKHLLCSYRILLQNEKAADVLANINQQLDGKIYETVTNFTENRLLDALLQTKNQRCQQEQIVLTTQIDLPPTYDNIPFMILLSNLIDNATEAEVKEPVAQRQITIEIIKNDNMISAVVQNFISHSVLKENPELKSTKKADAEHGLGLKSVHMIVEEQSGMMDIYEKDTFFCVHVIIPLL